MDWGCRLRGSRQVSHSPLHRLPAQLMLYASYTSILVSVRKTEDLLRRHRKGKKAGFSLFASSTTNTGPSVEEEEQRFKQQMTADVMALAKEIEKMGISLKPAESSGIPGWTALVEVADGRGETSFLLRNPELTLGLTGVDPAAS